MVLTRTGPELPYASHLGLCHARTDGRSVGSDWISRLQLTDCAEVGHCPPTEAPWHPQGRPGCRMRHRAPPGAWPIERDGLQSAIRTVVRSCGDVWIRQGLATGEREPRMLLMPR